jgi:glycosyltransferase involved in cell wall biosynthesis
MELANRDKSSTGNVLEIVNEVNRVSGITTFSKNFFQHPYLTSVVKITVPSRPFLSLASGIAKSRVVYCHQLYSMDIFAITLFCIVFRKPLILVSHGNLIVRSKSRCRKLFFLTALSKVMLLCNSSTQFLNQNEKERSFKLTSSSCICPPYLSGDSRAKELVKSLRRAVRESGVNNTNYKFCYLGANYYERKGFDRMLAMCLAIRETGKNVTLDMIGVVKTDEISKKVSQFKLEGVINFIDPIYGEEKSKKLASYDALVLLSRSEGWPMVVLESIDLNVPVIVSSETNVAELVAKYELGLVVKDFKCVEWLRELNSLSFYSSKFFEDHDSNIGFEIMRDKFLC